MRPVRPMLLSCVCWLLGGTTGVAAAALHVAPDATVPAVATSDAPATDATLDAAAQFDMLDGRRPKTLLSEGPHLAQERRRTARFELPTSEGAKEEERVAPTVQTLDVALDEALDAEWSQPLSAVAESAAAVVEPSHDPANPSGQHGRALCHGAATVLCRHHHSPHGRTLHSHAPTDRCGCGAVPANWKCIDTSLNSCNRCPTDYYRTGEKSA